MRCLFPLNKYAWFNPAPVHFECPSENCFHIFAQVFLYSSDGFFVPSCTTVVFKSGTPDLHFVIS